MIRRILGKVNAGLVKIIFASALAILIAVPLISQPSGGPYGPVYTKYEIPNDAKSVIYVAPEGKDDNSGRSIDSPTTLKKAITNAATGDVVVLRGGTYRTGNIVFNQGITIQPYADEQPVIKGSLVASEWENLRNGLWISKWDNLFPAKPADWWRRNRSGKTTPMHRFNDDMVFVNGRFLQSAGWEGEVDENSFYIDYDRKIVYIGVDPTDKLIEITAYNGGLIRTTAQVNGKVSDKKGPKVKGIIFTQYAYRAFEIEGYEPEEVSPEKNHGKDVVGSEFENCTFTFCSRVAGYFRGDNMVFRNCKVSDTSFEGLYIIASNDVLLERNIFMRNNIENIDGYFPAAVKIFNQSYRVICRDNFVTDMANSNGIWYDVGNIDGIFINNWIENVGYTNYPKPLSSVWPSQNGFFFEISKGVICAGNVFKNCDQGVLILNSSGAEIYNNTFINSTATIARDSRSAQGDHFGWHPSSGPDVHERVDHVFVNNIMFGDKNYTRPLFFVWQPEQMCNRLKDSPLKDFDYNQFVHKSTVPNIPIMYWTPVADEKCQLMVNDISDLQKFYPMFNKNSFKADSKLTVFQGAELNNYQLLNSYSGAQKAQKLPANVSSLLNWTKNTVPYIGAYPIKK
jgi:parallel beta-helix repeat protein